MNVMNRSANWREDSSRISRRSFALRAGFYAAGLALYRGTGLPAPDLPSTIALARSSDRSKALAIASDLLGRIDFGGRDVYLKANYNSPDPFPATTHPDMLTHVVGFLRESHCGRITLAERSGMGITREVWKELDIPDLARRLNLELLSLEDLRPEEWRKEDLPGSNWKSGIEVPGFLDRDAYVVQICNLKTHRFGAIFSASLKNSIGLVAKDGRLNDSYNYMAELHSSTQQGAMIAEVNQVYAPKLIFMDAMQVFVNGGPEAGEMAAPETVLISADRVAVDAAGVALLRLQMEIPGHPLSRNAVFEQDQIKRAVELNLGSGSAQDIRFLTMDAHSAMLASQLESTLQSTDKQKK
jgi:uncharacterized protein (DUF362 family)